MNHQDIPAYGLWSLVVINSAVLVIFAFSFFNPKTRREWRTFGDFSGVDPFGHDFGHHWYTASNLFVLAGFLLLPAAWRVLLHSFHGSGVQAAGCLDRNVTHA